MWLYQTILINPNDCIHTFPACSYLWALLLPSCAWFDDDSFAVRYFSCSKMGSFHFHTSRTMIMFYLHLALALRESVAQHRWLPLSASALVVELVAHILANPKQKHGCPKVGPFETIVVGCWVLIIFCSPSFFLRHDCSNMSCSLSLYLHHWFAHVCPISHINLWSSNQV